MKLLNRFSIKSVPLKKSYSDFPKSIFAASLNLSKYPTYRAEKYPKMEQNLRKKLDDYLKPYNEKFFKLIGKDFDW